MTSSERKPIEIIKAINGLEKVILRQIQGSSVEVYLYGAHVTSWKNEQGEELLFVSSKAIFKPPKPIRGGIPICFPQFSNLGSLETHGFARNRFWTFDDDPPPPPPDATNKVFIDLILRSTKEDLKLWPHSFEYRLRITLGPEGDLLLTSRIKNTGTDGKPLTFSIAYHNYFSVSDISEVRVEGLETLDYLDNCQKRERFTEQGDSITFESEVDRVYLSTPTKIKIMDHEKKRTFVIRKEGLPDAVVWNPWDKKMRRRPADSYIIRRRRRQRGWPNIDILVVEFWVGNQELVCMYDKSLNDAGYINFKLARTNNRGDGLLTAVHKDYFRVIDHRDFLFNDFGDRVAQLLHVKLTESFSHNNNHQQILIVNTHLLFPHDSSLSLERLRQVYKILQSVEAYQKENNLTSMPIILCGDWNGSKRGHIYKFLRSQGFVSSYDTAHHYTDADAHKWVSHINHRGNICGVDFIWLLNPNKYRKLLKASWSDAVFGLFKYHVRRASLTEEDAFAILKADNQGDYITYSGFCEALRQLNFIGHPNGLSKEETKDLWVQADIDGNGVVDYKEFQQRIWRNSTRCDQKEEEEDNIVNGTKVMIGYNVKNAVLYPREAEKGMWPENYSLSDHARLTVAFSPIRMSSF